MKIKNSKQKLHLENENNLPKSTAITSDRKLKTLFEKINEYVSDNITNMNDISVNNIAARFDISVGYVSKLYRKITSKTYISYVHSLKVEEAKKLLINNPNLMIKDIAEKLGYSNPISFIRLFKKHTGMSPGEYRKKMGDDKL